VVDLSLNKTESIIYGIGLLLMFVFPVGKYTTNNDGFIFIGIPGCAMVLWSIYTMKRRLKKQKSPQTSATPI